MVINQHYIKKMSDEAIMTKDLRKLIEDLCQILSLTELYKDKSNACVYAGIWYSNYFYLSLLNHFWDLNKIHWL